MSKHVYIDHRYKVYVELASVVSPSQDVQRANQSCREGQPGRETQSCSPGIIRRDEPIYQAVAKTMASCVKYSTSAISTSSSAPSSSPSSTPYCTSRSYKIILCAWGINPRILLVGFATSLRCLDLGGSARIILLSLLPASLGFNPRAIQRYFKLSRSHSDHRTCPPSRSRSNRSHCR